MIHDPAAARAVHTVLRAATGAVRKAVIEALVGERDPRVVPMLVQILEESEPLGKDHDVVIETIDGLGTVGTDAAVPVLVKMAQRRRFFGGQEAARAEGAQRRRPRACAYRQSRRRDQERVRDRRSHAEEDRGEPGEVAIWKKRKPKS